MKRHLRLFLLLLPLLILACSKSASPPESSLAASLAVTRGDVDEMKRLLASGADVNGRDKDGATLLMSAALSGSKEIAQLLVARGADINARDLDGLTPLHFAAMNGNRDIAELLIARSADVNAKNDDDLTPLGAVVLTAAITGDASCALPQLSFIQRWTIQRTIKISKAERLEVAKLLIDHGASLETGSKQPPMLYVAANCGDQGLAEMLIDHGANLDEAKTGETALHAAIAENHGDVAELLINKGASVNARNTSARTPLHFLARFIDDQNLAEPMITHGADINARDKNGATPLTLATKAKNVHVAQALQRHGGI